MPFDAKTVTDRSGKTAINVNSLCSLHPSRPERNRARSSNCPTGKDKPRSQVNILRKASPSPVANREGDANQSFCARASRSTWPASKRGLTLQYTSEACGQLLRLLPAECHFLGAALPSSEALSKHNTPVKAQEASEALVPLPTTCHIEPHALEWHRLMTIISSGFASTLPAGFANNRTG